MGGLDRVCAKLEQIGWLTGVLTCTHIYTPPSAHLAGCPAPSTPTRPAQPGMVDGVVVADGLMWALLLSRTEVSGGIWGADSQHL